MSWLTAKANINLIWRKAVPGQAPRIPTKPPKDEFTIKNDQTHKETSHYKGESVKTIKNIFRSSKKFRHRNYSYRMKHMQLEMWNEKLAKNKSSLKKNQTNFLETKNIYIND